MQITGPTPAPTLNVQATASAAMRRLTTADVTPAALSRATGDGDGRTGAAALNDGDSAAQAARRGTVSVHA